MGFILIVPLLLLSGWIIYSTWKLNTQFFSGQYTRTLMKLLVVGAIVGVLFTVAVKYSFTAALQFYGFPVPVAFLRTELGKTTMTELSPLLKCAATAANFLSGLALALLPLKVILTLKQFKAESRVEP